MKMEWDGNEDGIGDGIGDGNENGNENGNGNGDGNGDGIWNERLEKSDFIQINTLNAYLAHPLCA